jgi:hypothetical protein
MSPTVKSVVAGLVRWDGLIAFCAGSWQARFTSSLQSVVVRGASRGNDLVSAEMGDADSGGVEARLGNPERRFLPLDATRIPSRSWYRIYRAVVSNTSLACV